MGASVNIPKLCPLQHSLTSSLCCPLYGELKHCCHLGGFRQQTDNYTLVVLEASSLKSRYCQAMLPLQASGENPVSSIFQWLLVFLEAANVIPPLSALGLFLSVPP